VLIKTTEEGQPLVVGDVLLAIEEKPVKTTAEALGILLQMQSQDRVSLKVRRGTAQVAIPIKLTHSPMEVRFDNPNILFNRQLVSYKKTINITNNPVEKNVALLNIGLCLMHFGEYDAAFDQLRQVQLDRTYGIGQAR
jgi:hypothetical protein